MTTNSTFPVLFRVAAPRLTTGIVWLLLALIWFGTLGYRDLIHPDEGRYASIALEMLRSGDWITPRLNGLLYFEKPILQYWMGAISFALFGVNDFAARFWPGLTGFLTVAAVGFTGQRLWGQSAGQYAALVMGGAVWCIGNSHFLTLDSGLAFFLAVALCAFLLAQRDGTAPRDQRRWMWLAWAAMAGATLSKGLIGLVIPGATLVLYSLVNREFAFWRRLSLLSGSAIYLALTAPWFIAVSLRNPDFANFFFIHEHFQRFLTTEHRRAGPIWYFVPILLVGFLPWTSLLPRLAREGTQRDEASRFQAPRLLLIWAAFTFVFFSVSGSKLPSYILPMFPALALLLGRTLTGIAAPALRRHLVLPMAFWLIPIGLYPFVSRFASTDSPLELMAPFALLAAIGGQVFIALAIVAWQLLGQGRKLAGVLTLAFASILAVSCVQIGHNSYGQLKSARQAAEAVAPWLKPDTALFSVRYYDQTFPYYLRRNVTLVAYKDEFQFGEEREPWNWIPNVDAFVSRWQAAPGAVAMMTKEAYDDLAARGLRMHVVYRDPRRLVVVKP